MINNTFILEKRVSEAIIYNIDCSDLLNTLETIVTVTGVNADQAGLTLLGAAVNTVPVTFPDGITAAVGKVISIQISDGVIPAPQLSQLYTIRPVFVTSANNTREATVLLNVTNVPDQAGRNT
jgi:hypothetical protein